MTVLPKFTFPLTEIRMGFYSAAYFNKTKEIAKRYYPQKTVTMQIFQKNDGTTICGITEVLELLKGAVGSFTDRKKADQLFKTYLEKKLYGKPTIPQEEALNKLWKSQFNELTIKSLKDGNSANSWETVMHISGPYASFAHLESIYLGILARRTRVATNTARIVKAANGKIILYFADRFDYFTNQIGDGYAAKIGGANASCTDAMGYLIGEKGIGTIPHALVSLFDGDTVQATKAFAETFPKKRLIALVDFDNDCVKTSIAVAKALEDKLWGVRLDTAKTMVDLSLFRNEQMGKTDPRGVNPVLVKNVREALDQEGFHDVKIIVSGGFTPERIAMFEKQKCPVDIYGVGSFMLSESYNFTADVVKVKGKSLAKKGRCYRPNPKLKEYQP